MLSSILLLIGLSFFSNENKSLEWLQSLGSQTQKVKNSISVIDQIVLVKNENDFLSEISNWSSEEQWPILFEDDPLAWQFINSFKPKKVLIHKSSNNEKISKEKIELLLNTIHKNNNSIYQSIPGTVLMSIDDPSWTAGISLALGRGQRIAWLDKSWGKMGSILEVKETLDLLTTIQKTVSKKFKNWNSLGDDLDAVTVCKNIPGTAKWKFNKATRPYDPPKVPGANPNLVAITDLIGRDPFSTKRWAITGLIFGTAMDAARVAMSSLFLNRDSWLLVETYPNNPPWNLFRLDSVHKALKESGSSSSYIDQSLNSKFIEKEIELNNFIAKNRWGMNSDIVLFNSQGESNNFGLGHGENTNKVSSNYFPISNKPFIISIIHSWSARHLGSDKTVGGRILKHGGYAYVGSVVEPGLAGFKTPSQLVANAHPKGKHIPFLPSARLFNKNIPASNPWMIQTFGDPLMMLGSQRNKILPGEIEKNKYEDTFEIAKKESQNAINALKENKPAQEFLEKAAKYFFLSNTNVKNQNINEYLRDLWKLACNRKIQNSRIARIVLPALYKLRDKEEIARSALIILKPTLFEKDLVWSALSAHPNKCSNHELSALLKTVRETSPETDLVRIDELVAQKLGGNVLREKLNEISKYKLTPKSKKEIQRLQKRWGI